MDTLVIGRNIAAIILLGILSACGGSAPTPQQPASSQSSSAAPAASAETPAPTPTLVAEAESPTAISATIEPILTQETPTPEVPDESPIPGSPGDASALLPRDLPWAQAGTTIYVPGTATMLDAVTEGDPTTVYQLITAPDGSAIAYVSQVGNSAQLVIRDTITGESQVVGDAGGGAVAQVRFSPDGQSLAYAVVQQNSWQLNVWDRASGTSRTLHEGPLMASQGTMPYVLFPVAWTPTGLFVERIIYASDAPPQGLALLDPESGEVQLLRESSHLMAVPTDDGTSVALLVGERPMLEAPTAQIIRFDVGDRSETELTPMQTRFVKTIAWSPDGTRLLYTTSDADTSRETSLHLVQADGSDEQTVVFGQLGLLAPLRDATWQDAGTILVLLWDENRQFELHALPISSFDPRSLRSLGAFDAAVAQGQSVRIVYVP